MCFFEQAKEQDLVPQAGQVYFGSSTWHIGHKFWSNGFSWDADGDNSKEVVESNSTISFEDFGNVILSISSIFESKEFKIMAKNKKNDKKIFKKKKKVRLAVLKITEAV